MASDTRLVSPSFPRSSAYHPDWVMRHGMGGANALWLMEWLATAMDLRPGMRVLDLGCGRATSSVFLAREFGAQVFAADLWITASQNQRLIADAGLADQVIPLHADARSLPFASEFFDAITCIDAYFYFGTDDLYLNYIAQFLKPGGQIGIAGAGLTQEIEGDVPVHLAHFWTQDYWCLHSAPWWQRHWQRTGIVEIETADAMADGWRFWLDWQVTAHPENRPEIEALQADHGRVFTYTRTVARRRAGVKLDEYCWPDNLRFLPTQYERQPLLRGQV